MADEGHLVCNHTKNHKNLSLSSAEEIKNNLTALEKIYEEKTGNKMAAYFRFPEGKYSEEALKAVKNLGYKTIFWSLAYADWDNNKQPNIEKSKKLLLDNTHNGAVILLHPTSDTNVKILDELIVEWKNRGYSFGTLDELVK
jgi:peptidoglycan-N-acetylmuramic acid deacetylase